MEGSPFSSTAIKNINFEIEDGEFIGLIGHTGCGKSTLVQHLNGLLKPTSGKILIDGQDITLKETKLSDIRKKVGLVFQYPEYQLFEETVAKDIAFGPKNIGCPNDEIEKRVQLACKQVGLDFNSIAERSPFELSGGQMRRVAIAGVLAMQPKILVLDEPTAGLDPAGRTSILNMIRTLHCTNKMTIIMVSHNMDDIATLATKLLVMNKGEMALSGTPTTVFSEVETLHSIGLDVPQAATLISQLQKLGYNLPNGLFTLNEAKDAILKLWKRGNFEC